MICWTGNGGLDGRKHSSRLKPSQGWTWCNANYNLRTKLSFPGTSIKISHYPIPRGTQNTSVLIQFSSVQLLSRVWLFATPWTVARQASLSITNSWRLLKLMSIESVMPSNHIIFCRPILLLPSVFPSIRVFSNESALHIRWPKYWSFSFNTSPSNEHPELISFRMDWLDLLAVQGTLKHNSFKMGTRFTFVNSRVP